jgi:hypothetical protein
MGFFKGRTRGKLIGIVEPEASHQIKQDHDELAKWKAIVDAKADLDRKCETEPPTPKPSRKLSTNERMQATLASRPEAYGWSVRQWAENLGCSTSTIAETETWHNLNGLHRAKRAGFTKDRRRRTKGT